MSGITWDEEKNGWLKRNRGIGFDQVAVLIERGQTVLKTTIPSRKMTRRYLRK